MTAELISLIQRSQQADESAFRDLVHQHYTYVFRVVFRVIGDEQDAKDAAQETFIKVWQNIGSFDPRMTFTTWLYRVAANTALDRYRHRSRQMKTMVPLTHDHESIHGQSPTRAFEQRDLAGIVRGMLSRLSPAQRLVFALRDCEDLSIEEVRTVTGLSRGSIKTNLSYARRRVRELLDTEYSFKGES